VLAKLIEPNQDELFFQDHWGAVNKDFFRMNGRLGLTRLERLACWDNKNDAAQKWIALSRLIRH